MATEKRVELTNKKTGQKVEMNLDRYNSLTSKQRDEWTRGRTFDRYLGQKKTASQTEAEPLTESPKKQANVTPVDKQVSELEDELKEAKARVLDLETQLTQLEANLVAAATETGLIEFDKVEPDLDTLGGKVVAAINFLTQQSKEAEEERAKSVEALQEENEARHNALQEQLMRIATATKNKTKAKEAGNDVLKVATVIADSLADSE